jgi:hypothetical protein
MNGSTPDSPEVSLTESARAAATDLAELAAALPGADRHRAAEVATRIAEECAEVAAMIAALPGRPVAMSGHDYALLSALSTARSKGEDVGEFGARGLARLAAELGARGLARLAAELGGSEHVLANRPGSWEAAVIEQLLQGTVGPDDEMLGGYAGPGAGSSL